MIDKTDPTNRDTVPAMLTPGEFVLNKEASTMFAPVIEQMNAAGLQHRAIKNMGGGIPTYNKGGDVKPSLQQGIAEAAAALGVDPIDLATIISYETAGTLSPTQKGPTTKWGQHRGYIQFGEPQAKEYGVDFSSEDSAMSSQLGANGAIVKYFKAHGFEPGMGLMDLYSIVNAGGPGRYNWSDEKAGGAKGTVADKVIKQMPAHRDKAIKLLGVNFAPETSVRPQSRGDVPPQATPQLTAQANPIAVEQAIMQASVPQVQAAPPVPTDFGEAFKDARADMGAGGTFTFRGRDYTTDYVEEKDKTMTANMGGSVYLNMGGYPQEHLDNYRKAIMANMGPEYLARIAETVSMDAARELQAQVRPDYTPGNVDYTPGNVEGNFDSSQYNDPAFKLRSDGMIDLRGSGGSDRRLDKKLYLSQPNTGMTTEEAMAKRKNLASNSYVPMPEVNSDDPVTNPSSGFGSSLEYNYDTYLKEMGYNDVPAVREMWRRYQDKMNAKSAEVPMPEVNSDESLLQGSSGSVASAARSFPSDYPINMDVPKVEGYNIPAPIPAPRPTMFGGQLYYLNGDGLVTDSNGNPVQDPEIGAAVQDKLNYSPEESAANAQAYNESMAEQAVFNGVAPQSVNPSYDSMRQQQESNAAEAERIRAEIAQTDMERQALNDEFNNREPVVDYNIPASMQDAGRMMANNVPMGDGVPRTAASSIPKPSINYSGISFDALVTLANDGDEKAQDELVQRNDQANLNDIAVDDRRSRGYSVLTETPIDPNRPQITGDLSPSVYSESQQLGIPIPQGVDFNYEGPASGVSSHTQALEVLKTPSLPEDDYVKANEALSTPDTVVTPVSPDTFDPRGEGTGRQKFAAASKVEGIINNLPEDDKKTSKDQDLAAKEAAAAEEARLTQAGGGDAKNTPEVKGAMSAIKSMFGDLFDTKELARAAILYLGGRATGLNGNQALAFAGKNYLARVDAKEGTYQKIALEGKHTKDSLAVYKKTMNPADLVAKGQPPIETGEYKDLYHTKSGTPVKLIEKETSTGRKLYYYKGEQVDLNDFTADGRYSVGSKDHDIYVGQLESAVISQVKELQGINMTDSDSDGKGSKPIIGITPTGVATQAAKYVIKNQLPREVMRDLVSIAYQDAVAEKMSTGKTPPSLEPFFERAYVKSRTSNVVNFTLGNGKPAPAASVNQFFRTIRDMATAAEQVENPDFKLSSLNDTQLSTWLLQSKTYTSWNQITDPEEKKFFVDRGAKEVPPRSGFMQYVLEGYPKTS
jgi:hypothetical protein